MTFLPGPLRTLAGVGEQPEVSAGLDAEVLRVAQDGGGAGGGVLHVEDRVVAGRAGPTGRGRCRSGCRRWTGRGRTARRRRRSPRPGPRCVMTVPARLLIRSGSPSRTRLTSWPMRISRLTRGVSPNAAHIAMQPADVAGVVGAEHDQDAVEAPLALVEVVGQVAGDVRRNAVALDDDPVLVVAEVGRSAARPRRPSRRSGPRPAAARWPARPRRSRAASSRGSRRRSRRRSRAATA